MSSIIARAAGVIAILSLLFISTPGIASADSANLIANPSFENGTSGWQADGLTNPTVPLTSGSGTYNLIHTDWHTGTTSAQITLTSATGDAKWAFSPQNLIAGQYYTFSDWYKSSTTTTLVLYYDGACASGCWQTDVAPSTTWNYASVGFIVPAGATNIQVAHVISGTVGATLTTDDFSLVMSDTPPTFPHGIVTLTFDDGWQSFWDNASSSLLTNHVPATNYIITTAGMDSDQSNCATKADPLYPDCYMTPAEVQALQANGFDIGNHTATHPDLAHDPVSLTTEITNPRTELQTTLGAAAATTDPVDTFAYPFGQYNLTVEQAVKNAGMSAARSVDQGFNLLNTNRYALKMQQVRTSTGAADDHTTTLADIQSWVQQAAADKSWLILMFHNIRNTEAGETCTVHEDDNGNVIAQPGPIDPDCNTLDLMNQISAWLGNSANLNGAVLENMHQVVTNELANDTIPPVIVLNGALATTTAAGSTFVDPGVFSVTDNKDIVPTNPVVTSIDTFNGAATTTTALNTKISGTWVLKYSVADAAGNVGSTTRTVTVGVAVAPVVTSVATTTFLGIPTPVTLTATGGSGTYTFATTSNPTYGTLTGSGANLVYTPVATTTAYTDSFTFKANDSLLDSNVATATITVALAPSIVATNIVATPGQTDATITWNTVTLASSTVLYGADATYGATTSVSALTTSHSVALSGLSAGTTYHFAVVSTDTLGNTATSSDQTFVTTATTPVTPPSSGGGGGGGGGGGFSYYGSVQVNIGAATSTSRLVSLQLSSNASQVWISNDSAFTTGGFMPLTSNTQWSLSLGTGPKTVYVRFGSASSTVASAQTSIYLNDGTPLAPITTSTGSTNGQVLGASTATICYTFTKSLSIGSTGADVTALQNTLTSLGYYNGPVTGYLGALTSAGISKFQAANGLDQVGIVGPMTRAALNTCSSGATAPATTADQVLGTSTGPTTFTETLSVGSTGDQVTALQTKLTTLNDYNGPITGTFGPLTKAGVQQFQANNSISMTGTVGPLTRAALNTQ